MGWKQTGHATVRQQRGRWVVRVDGIDTATGKHRSRATFLRYFSTLAELRNEAAARVVERFPDLFVLPTMALGGLDERIRRSSNPAFSFTNRCTR